MSAHLLIHDGNPWWASPDIWVVPGSDPNGAPGSPLAGQPNYLWARVSNTGNLPVSGARIDFYWANPAADVIVGVATLVGSAYADLAPGTSQDVLCLVPWIPVIVNGGHECLVAVVHGAGDDNPLPDPLPNGFDFDPPAHDQIAQLNVAVLEASMLRMPLTVFVNATGRVPKRAQLRVVPGGALDARLLANLGLRGVEPTHAHCVDVTLGREPACHDPHAKPTLTVEVPRGTSVPVFVHIDAQNLPRNHYQLIHLEEHDGERLLGGVSYVIVNTRGPQANASKEESGL